MFSNVGWSEMMILLVAALVILGPERLPGAVRWTTRSLRQVRDYASGATSQLKQELGPEFEELRKPLAELNELRGMSPRAAVTKHLLGGDDSVLRDLENAVPDKQQLFGTSSGMPGTGSTSLSKPSLSKPLERNERPPIDLDAT
ncbi:Sec-independent protein translocase protein TatB [Nocardia asteroides]|uniref:Sec-independent protein translocase protein TatB n=1 Tax=Nocardia asteroides NBRC 15531 TaxID=1110697 RepID=U5EGN0_NOCAS|nr:Sec-independent protein translocase protein TatB [Nocardia asteroides]TLF70071.1 Sec-independent protein translocase subunit TatB [Nocardia asteroides NBRC 15531]UGT49598.1 Sec-independent protein translocase protein TatB [Nocardia asteroides]GAD84314.1 Sec-independent protein translocase protein TatB homolog [Nocardia asteroides NBRC 15531]